MEWEGGKEVGKAGRKERKVSVLVCEVEWRERERGRVGREGHCIYIYRGEERKIKEVGEKKGLA